ncbi:MAG TPA: HYR domain-containing protein [Blastocatellia bacterium]|nr:HYR domain-containing protein [Blastocatellia bacterium]
MRLPLARIIAIASLALAAIGLGGWSVLEASSGHAPVLPTPARQETHEISSARKALDNLIADRPGRFNIEMRSAVADALESYQSAVDARVSEIHERLKQLDSMIGDPPSTGALDDPANSPYLHSRPEVSGLIAEYESYRSELSALGTDLNDLKKKVKKSLGLQAASCPPATIIHGTLGSGSPDVTATSGQQTGRLLNGLGNITCGSSNPCTLNTATGLRTFDAYTFSNTGSTTACVTVHFTMTGCALGASMQFSTRLGSFDPANPCANYVGDGGAGFGGESDRSFSFNVPAGQDFVVVVNENDPAGAVGCAYTLTISGLSCQATCPPATITGTIGQGSTDYPSSSGVQSARVSQNGVDSSCAAPKTCPGVSSVGSSFAFDSYNFVNDSGSPACVTFTFPTACGVNNAVHPVAYLGSFDPANPCTNYIGDIGHSINASESGAFSVTFPANSSVVLVVHEVGSQPGCADYSFSVSGLPCQLPCTITCPANITKSNDSNLCGATVSYPAPVTSGNCGAVSCSPASGSFFPVGATTVTCSTASGSSCSFTVTVNDTQPPTISCPANISTATSVPGASTTVVTFPSPVASDNCGAPTKVCTPPSGSVFLVGTTTVTCQATDNAGNTASCSFTVSVSNLVIRDDATATLLRVTHNGGPTAAYQFFDCSKGITLSGTASVTTAFCKFNIVDNGPGSKPSQPRLSAVINTCTLRGTATVLVGATTYSLNDGNVSNSSPVCP